MIIFELMNFLDIILIIPIIIGAWRGYKKGIIIEFFTLLAFFAGIYGAFHFSDYITEIFQEKLDLQGKYLPIVSFVFTFLLFGALVYFAGIMLEKAVKTMKLSPLNKFAGICFGILKMLFLSGIIVIVLESINEKNDMFSEETKDNSLLYKPLKKMTFTTLPFVKESKLFDDKTLFQNLLNKE